MNKINALLALTVLVAFLGTRWEMTIIADIPSTDRHAIQFAILEFNPTETFVGEFSDEYLKEALKTAKTDEEKDVQIKFATMVNWDILFKKVTADKLSLLNEKDTCYHTETESEVMEMSHSKNRWLTSKAFTIDGKPYCYAVPFVVSDGSYQTCKLDASNMISLVEVYQKQIIK